MQPLKKARTSPLPFSRVPPRFLSRNFCRRPRIQSPPRHPLPRARHRHCCLLVLLSRGNQVHCRPTRLRPGSPRTPHQRHLSLAPFLRRPRPLPKRSRGSVRSREPQPITVHPRTTRANSPGLWHRPPAALAPLECSQRHKPILVRPPPPSRLRPALRPLPPSPPPPPPPPHPFPTLAPTHPT